MKLDLYRRQRGVTLAFLAALVGVSEVAMSRYERGSRIPRPEIMRRIVTATEGAVQPNDFHADPREGEAA